MSTNVPTISNPYARIAPAPSARHVWTEDEDSYLREHWDGTTAHMRLVGDALNIPWYEVRDHALELGLTNPIDKQPVPKGHSRRKPSASASDPGDDDAALRALDESQPPLAATVDATMPAHVCQECSNAFIPRTIGQRFCSRACAGKYVGKQRRYHQSRSACKGKPAAPTAPAMNASRAKIRRATHMCGFRTSIPTALTDLLQMMPVERSWTRLQRRHWKRAFMAMVDLLWTVRDVPEDEVLP